MKRQIKVIKKTANTNQTANNTIRVLHTETRRGAAETVKNWISDYRQQKEIERQKALAFLSF